MMKDKLIWQASIVFFGLLFVYALFLDFTLRIKGSIENNFQSLVASLGIFYTLVEYRKKYGYLKIIDGIKAGFRVVFIGGFFF